MATVRGFMRRLRQLKSTRRKALDAQLKVNIIGLMAGQRVEGRTWPTFAEQGITINGKPYAFTKEYFVFYPIGISKEYVAAMNAAMEVVCNSAEYKAEIEKLGYKAQFMDSEDANDHIYEKREAFRKLIEDAPSFDDLVG
ncbi:MAG TPA: hypothetical protein DDZ65_08880 [Firmicutes bacterium]|nr:hypothetical protein [Bacillota bacterium]